MMQTILFWLILWFLPILTVLSIYYICKYKNETFNQYIMHNDIKVFAFGSFIPCVGIFCMIVLILFFIINRKY